MIYCIRRVWQKKFQKKTQHKRKEKNVTQSNVWRTSCKRKQKHHLRIATNDDIQYSSAVVRTELKTGIEQQRLNCECRLTLACLFFISQMQRRWRKRVRNESAPQWTEEVAYLDETEDVWRRRPLPCVNTVPPRTSCRLTLGANRSLTNPVEMWILVIRSTFIPFL